jgi:hypothetical protein
MDTTIMSADGLSGGLRSARSSHEVCCVLAAVVGHIAGMLAGTD